MRTTRAKTAGCFALALLLVPGLMLCLGAAAWADGITTWTELQTALDAGGTVVLTQNVTAGENDSALEIGSEVSVVLDLNGCSVDRGLQSAEACENGNVFTVEGELTVTDSEDSGVITGGGSTDGGGGVMILPGGRFTMEGGAVRGNRSEYVGGGVAVGSGAVFVLNDGAVEYNSAIIGGGLYAAQNAEVYMLGGSISFNASDNDGGGVALDCMEESGSVLYMSGGTIRENSAGGDGVGGGVYVTDGAAVVLDDSPVIADNFVRCSGETVLQSNIFLEDGAVQLCGALTDSADVGVFRPSEETALVVEGTVDYTIQESDKNRFSGEQDRTLLLDAGGIWQLGSGNPGFAFENGAGDNFAALSTEEEEIIASGPEEIENCAELTPGRYFLLTDWPMDFRDSRSFTEQYYDENSRLFIYVFDLYTGDRINVYPHSYWQDLQDMILSCDPNSADPIALEIDIIARPGETCLRVPAGCRAGIDLNGHILCTKIAVEGELTLTDSAPTAAHDPAVAYEDPLTGNDVTVTGGVIVSDGNGSAVTVDGGALTMTGGSIAGGVTSLYGGGVYVESGAFTMKSGSICGNHADMGGGGVYVAGGAFNMEGGSITGNSAYESVDAVRNGGGVYVKTGGAVFSLKGAPDISGNIGGQVWLEYDQNQNTSALITVAGALTNETPIGVGMCVPGVFTSGWAAAMGGADPALYFGSDDGDHMVKLLDGEAAVADMVFGTPDITLPGEVTAIGKSAFEGAALHIVSVPDTCVSVGANAFKNCAGLTQIRLPKDCAISAGAFDGCTALIAVFAPAGGTTQSWCAQAGVPFAAE